MSWVAILMGSESDWPTMQSCKEVFDELDVTSEVRVTSAHRTPKETQEYVLDAEAVSYTHLTLPTICSV